MPFKAQIYKNIRMFVSCDYGNQDFEDFIIFGITAEPHFFYFLENQAVKS